MSDIRTNNPVDPAVLVALKAIQIDARGNENNTSRVPSILERLIEAVKEITDR